jgi:hypothetical protein
MGLSMWLGAGSMLTGYLIMLAAFSLIFIGIKRCRDTELGGVIRFWTALGVGLGIALVASAIYVAGWELYMYLTNYTFFDSYAKGVIAAKRASGASAAEIAKLTREMAAMGRQYAEPLYRMVMTLFEILPVGVVVALISAALLRNSRFLSMRGPRTS